MDKMNNNDIYKTAESYSGGKLNSEAIKQAAKSGNTDALIKAGNLDTDTQIGVMPCEDWGIGDRGTDCAE